MHGRSAEINSKSFGRHMLSIPSRGSTTVAVQSGSSSSKSFVKDGRMIKVGDCALFKSPHESPPFIGIIHELTSTSNDIGLKLGVSWLYRPGEVELGEGDAIGAAPNEVFYSFHRDETPAASLLHPCKVAFLPKGAELPSGVSSFVCRRVYDITNRCLWWLTDKDFLNVHQEEINKLLQKSCLEMHTTVQQQQGTHSPKPVNGATTASPLKQSPESMQGGGSNLYSSQCKGRKRELSTDQASEPLKRERRTDDADSNLLRSDSTLKSEIVRIAGRGGLLNSEAVERLVQLMLSEKSQRKVDLSNRLMLAGILAATDKSDCLDQFVQSKGLPILDEWLKEVHKGKVCDLTGLKESEKSVEDFLFVMIRALDKLPMNLDALQICNIGKSVNHLRTHKNTEIQKKSRCLVDKWKKRVEAEMSSNLQKSSANQAVSCPLRSRHEATLGGNKHNGGLVDSATRSSSHLTHLKSGFTKHVHGETTVKSSGVRISPSSPAHATSYKEEQPNLTVPCCGGPEPPQPTNGEDKSSSSSQSYTHSQCSSDRARNFVSSGKDDARSSPARSKSVHKNSGFFSHKKSANGLQGMAHDEQESWNTRSSVLNKALSAEKSPPPRATGVSNHSSPAAEGNSHKIFVKIPNQGRSSPGLNTNPSAVVDPTSRNSRASSPDLSDKHVQTVRAHTSSPSHGNNEDDGLPAASLVRMQDKNCNAILCHLDVPKIALESSIIDTELKKSVDSSLNTPIESCVKDSEANVYPTPVGDETGMNLLATVAAGVMSTTSVTSPEVSGNKVASAAHYSIADDEDAKQSNRTSSISPPSTHDNVLEQKDNSLTVNGNTAKAFVEFSSSSSSIGAVGNNCGGENISMGLPIVKDENHDPVSESRHVTGISLVLPQGNVKIEAPVGNNHGTVQEDKPTCVLPKSNDHDNDQQVANNNASLEKLPSLAGSLESLSKKEGQDGAGGILSPDTRFELSSVSANEKESCGLPVEDENLRTKEENKDFSSIRSNAIPGSTEQIEVCKGVVVGKQGSMSHSDGSPSKVNLPAEEVELPSSSKSTCAVASVGREKDELGDATDRASSPPTTQVPDLEKKPGFDLNEGLSMDDGKTGESINVTSQFVSVVPLTSSSFSSSGPVGIHASVTVAAAAKGPFVPLEELLKNTTELGWKGSAATSAFRPAEPRKVNEPPLHSRSKLDRPVFDFDLNVTDEKLLQDMGCLGSAEDSNHLPYKNSCGLELDLNQVDDAPELNHHASSNNKNNEIPSFPIKPIPFGGGFDNIESGKREFDLNDGPSTDEQNLEASLAYKSSIRFNINPQSPFGLRINNGTNTVGLPQWYSPGTTYSAITTALPLSSSGVGPPHKMLVGPTATSSFSSELYCGPVLTSSPTMPFTTTSFQYPVFPFGTNFPLPTSSLPGNSTAHVDPSSGGRFCGLPVPAQLMGMASVSSPYFRPCVSNHPEISNNGIVESSRKLGRQGLDLNSGPGAIDVEGRDEALLMPSRQLPVVGQHTLVSEDQSRTFILAGGGVMKRKEPEEGWEAERMRYKQPSWQ